MAMQDRDYYLNKTPQRGGVVKGSRRALAGSHHSFARRVQDSGGGKRWLLLGLLLFVLYWVVSDARQRLARQQAAEAARVAEQRDAEAEQDELEQPVGGVIIKADASGHFRGKVLINDVQMPFMIDTGATQTAIPERMASDASLPIGNKIQTNTAGGLVTNHATRLSTMRLGNAELKNVQAYINPHLNEVLIGMNTLKHFRMTQNKDILTLVASNGFESEENLEKALPLELPPPQFMTDKHAGAIDIPPTNQPPKVAKVWKKTMVCDANKRCSPSYAYQ